MSDMTNWLSTNAGKCNKHIGNNQQPNGEVFPQWWAPEFIRIAPRPYRDNEPGSSWIVAVNPTSSSTILLYLRFSSDYTGGSGMFRCSLLPKKHQETHWVPQSMSVSSSSQTWWALQCFVHGWNWHWIDPQGWLYQLSLYVYTYYILYMWYIPISKAHAA